MKKITFFFVLLATTVFSQTEVDKDLASPHATIYTHLFALQEDSYDLEKAASTIYGASEKRAEEIALKIKQVLDGKGLRVAIASLPKDPDYLDTLQNFGAEPMYVLFPNQLPEISVEKINENWYYSQETNQQIDRLYREVYPAGTELLKKSIPNVGHLRMFGLEVWQYLGFLVLLVLSVALFYIQNKVIFWLLKSLEKYLIRFAHNSLNDSLLKLSRPISWLLVFYALENYIPILQFPIEVNSFLLKGLHIGQTVLWIYVFLQLVQVLMDIYGSYSLKTESKLDDQLTPILKRLLRGLVFFVGGLKMLTIFGADVTTVIAGASIGGLAVALASQDTVRNLIGTFMIFLDKPFQIGDWIVGGGVEGTVEEVGFRSSRIRAADTSVFTIPNSKLSEIVINNLGLRLYRRYKTVLGIRYDTPPELIEAFVKGVRALVDTHPDTRSEDYNVEFTGFGNSALEILLNVYFKNPGWGKEQSSKHRLHIAIVKLAKELGVEFAFPSQTLMIEDFPEKQALDLKYDTDLVRTDKVIQEAVASFKNGLGPS
ncbi:MAG: mechanosensitive ion channel family protein [Flavicella sp.]|nr:mechanosensitive ion channel family protein [Flavicella sp.]